jgi:hypothetical protein
MTTLRLAPRGHRPALATNSVLPSLGDRLFFEQVFQGVPQDVEQACNATHTWSFMISGQDLRLFRVGFAMAGIHHRRFAASLAPKLLAPCSILAVLHDIRAVALWTVKN